jgi:dimethylhistidine N-methyltransferase
MSTATGSATIAASNHRLATEIQQGLAAAQKWLPCALLYDEHGSQLFEQICDVEEYYPTRVETAIMAQHADDAARSLGDRVALLEYGSGSSTKTRLLLDRLEDPAAYLPIDISCEQLQRAAGQIAGAYPALQVEPLCADYHQPLQLPELRDVGTYVAYFPGSTVGNFNMPEAVDFLGQVAATVGSGGALLIGVDLQKPTDTLERAYDDRQGVTAAFNLNVLTHLNRRWQANFDVERFAHRAIYNHARGRVEMHLVSRADQKVEVGQQRVEFVSGESILTEVSYKYTLDGFQLLAQASGFEVEQVWCDQHRRFSVQLLRAR